MPRIAAEQLHHQLPAHAQDSRGVAFAGAQDGEPAAQAHLGPVLEPIPFDDPPGLVQAIGADVPGDDPLAASLQQQGRAQLPVVAADVRHRMSSPQHVEGAGKPFVETDHRLILFMGSVASMGPPPRHSSPR